MRTYLTRRWGPVIQDPTENDLESALAELTHDDSEHPDGFLQDEDGWSLSAFSGGLVVLENVETGEGPWHMTDVPREDVLALWTLMQRGKMEQIRQRLWKSGYSE